MADARSMGSGMQGHLNLRDAPPPLTNFDNSDAVPTANAQALMPIQRGALHKDGSFISLLKRWCETNGKSISQRKRLYKKMIRQFQEYEVISPAHIEALKQCNCNILFKKLASWSLSSSSDDSPDGGAVVPFMHNMLPPDHDHSSFFLRRYKEDFIQKELLGEGGFGKVYRVQHQLDKAYYAVKKIKITKRESRSLQREIQTLACLNHPNVVRYHQSWLEEVVSQQTEKKHHMLALRSNDMGIGYEGEQEEEGIDRDGDDSFYEKSKNKYSSHSRQVIKLGSPNFPDPSEDERFDSGELVNEFFSQTSENVENIRPLACNKKEEEFDRITDSLESSGTSGSTIIFQNVELDGRDCDEFNLPSLKEQNSSGFEFVRQSQQTEKHIGTLSKSDFYKEIKITATTTSTTIVESTLIPVTSATAAFLSTITSSLSSSTRIHNRISTAPSRSQQPNRNGKFKRCYYLYIQMELCSSTLRTWLDERNENISKTENQFDVPVVNEKENRNIFKQILEVMNYIHTQGILHRDVTPKNIFLSYKDDGHPLVKLGDFGLAREDVLTEPKTPMRFRRDQDLDESSVDPCVSQTYTSDIGTKTYAAPEQLDGTTYDNKADMFSLGLILFELYYPCDTVMERCDCLRKLRKGDIPKDLQKRWPVQYSAIQCLTRQDSRERPSANDLLSGDMFPSKDKTKFTEEMSSKLNSEQAKVTELTSALDTTQMQLVEAKAGLAEKTQSELVLTDRVLELEASRMLLHAELTAEQQETANLKKQTELQGGLLAESISKCELLEEQIVTKDNVQKDVQKDMQQKIEVLEKELAKQRELCKNYEVKLESKMKDVESPEGKIQRLKKVSTQRDPVNSQRDAERCPLKENRIPKSHQTSGQQWD